LYFREWTGWTRGQKFLEHPDSYLMWKYFLEGTFLATCSGILKFDNCGEFSYYETEHFPPLFPLAGFKCQSNGNYDRPNNIPLQDFREAR